MAIRKEIFHNFFGNLNRRSESARGPKKRPLAPAPIKIAPARIDANALKVPANLALLAWLGERVLEHAPRY
jgi:hypothetical protein